MGQKIEMQDITRSTVLQEHVQANSNSSSAIYLSRGKLVCKLIDAQHEYAVRFFKLFVL